MNISHLCTTNASVNDHNNTLYYMSKSDKTEIKAIDIIVGDISDDMKRKIENKIPKDTSKTMGLYLIVSITTKGKYDVRTNIDVSDGLTNGTEYVIEKN